MQVTVSASNMLVTILLYLCRWESVAIIQVLLYAMHNCFYRKIQITVSIIVMQVFFLSLTPIFHKIDRKTLKALYQVCILPLL